jgi:DNA repair protein RecN (Recombination protein N)
MLRELKISDFAIIDEALIEFGPGLNVLTGETGAGKSILIEALGLALGGRFSEEMIRSSTDQATVEARFHVSEYEWLNHAITQQGVENDGELIIRRIAARSGRNKAFINGSMATVGQVKQFGDALVDIHGQNEHQALLDTQTHIFAFDQFLGLDQQREEYSKKFRAMTEAKRKLAATLNNSREIERKIDLLRHQAKEISDSGIVIDEDKKLLIEKTRLIHAEKLLEIAAKVIGDLDENENSAANMIHTAKTALDQMTELDNSLQSAAESVSGGLFQIEEAVSEIRRYSDSVERDPAKLEQVDDRLEIILNLKRKYGETIEEIIAFGENAVKELEAYEFDSANSDKLKQEAEKLEAEAGQMAVKLDAKRVKGAASFSKAVSLQLSDLNMENAKIEPGFTYEDKTDGVLLKDGRKVGLGPEGIGSVEFMFSANAGEPLKPLAKIASGGETSRLMLALKTIMKDASSAPVMIFDEIDTGIGGATADMLGRKLRDLAKTNQVFCITHLAQVARHAAVHFKVEKSESKGRVTVGVRRLDKEEKIAELARMATGSVGNLADTAALKWAEEALEEAQRG